MDEMRDGNMADEKELSRFVIDSVTSGTIVGVVSGIVLCELDYTLPLQRVV